MRFLPIILLGIIMNTHAQTGIVAHRGAWKNGGLPQNSLASLKHALQLGCQGTEFDINMSQDSVLVINHDADYFGKDIEKHSYAELNLTKLKNGEDLPLLKQFLVEAKAYPDTKLFAEIKPSPSGVERSRVIGKAVYEMVKAHSLLNRTIFISFSYEVLEEIRDLDKNAHTQFLGGNISAKKLQKEQIHGADYHFSVFVNSEKWISKAKELGLSTNAWTVNKPEIMEFLLDRQIDFLTTDEPELAMELNKKVRRELVWAEEFNYIGLPDSSVWNYDVGGHGWGNNEKQFYTQADSSNAMVKDGKLHITARLEDGKYTSARLVTKGKKEFQYGKFEVRAKLPKGRGTWPAIWMLGRNIDQAGWPLCGEIDIMEHVGHHPGVIVGTVHSEKYNHIAGTQISGKVKLDNYGDEFHVYAVDWSKEKIDFLIDNVQYLRIPNKFKTAEEWPFDQAFFLILNLAVGGNWGGQQGVDNNIFPVTFEVDYVRVFK